MLLAVENAQPWPKMQCFDFLVRARVLTDAERRRLGGPVRMSPQRHALLAALRTLTRIDAGEAAAAWRRALAATPQREDGRRMSDFPGSCSRRGIMSENSLCGYCIELPEQARAAARQVSRCPLCKTELGTGGGGRHFRVVDGPSVTRRRGLPLLLLLATVAAPAVLVTAWMLWADSAAETVALPLPPMSVNAPLPVAQMPPPALPEAPASAAEAKRYAVGVLAPDARLKPDVAEPVALAATTGATPTGSVAMPAAPFTSLSAAPSVLSTERGHREQALRRVPEVDLERPTAPGAESQQQANLHIAQRIQAIREADRNDRDGHLRKLIAARTDLAGLPFQMGDRCRLSSTDATALSNGSQLVRRALTRVRTAPPTVRKSASGSPLPNHHADMFVRFWSELVLDGRRPGREQQRMVLLPAVVQIVPPEGDEFRRGLVDEYENVAGAKVTQMLARLALYDLDPNIRRRAGMALRIRPKEEYTDVLLDGLRYPWAPVAEQAALLAVSLSRTDLLPQLISALEGPDPGAPFEKEIKGKSVTMVRELVRINHHRNCLLCHAPAPANPSRQMVLGPVPSPAEPLPPTFSPVYYNPRSKRPLVRADVTYLRQDFSLMMPVANADPWPEMQRYDFLVRTRALTDAEREAAVQGRQVDNPPAISPHRAAVLFALRGLMHRDVGDGTAAWRKSAGGDATARRGVAGHVAARFQRDGCHLGTLKTCRHNVLSAAIQLQEEILRRGHLPRHLHQLAVGVAGVLAQAAEGVLLGDAEPLHDRALARSMILRSSSACRRSAASLASVWKWLKRSMARWTAAWRSCGLTGFARYAMM